MAIRADEDFGGISSNSPEDGFGDSTIPRHGKNHKSQHRKRTKTTHNHSKSPKNDKQTIAIEQSVTPLAQQKSSDIELECGCSVADIKSCPSARIIKKLLKRLEKWKNSNKSEKAQSLHSVLEEYNYSVTKILDDIHHLKYEHSIDRDDALFDAAYDFFNESDAKSDCDVNHCRLVQRHYRGRGQQPVMSQGVVDSDTLSDEVLMDIMAMIHCYFVHSFDINRMTKAERENVEMTWSYGVSLDDAAKDDSENENMRRIKLIADILRAKEDKLQWIRGNRRYRDVEYGQSASKKAIDFAAMAVTAEVDEMVLRDGLSEYGKDADRLIDDLIVVVYGEDVGEMDIWKALKVEEDRKRRIFRQILYDHFKCTQLSTGNMIKICNVIIQRMEFQIDADAINEVLSTNGIDGRIYNKTNPETYQNVNVFAQNFKSVQNCHGPHIRRMYNVVKKWKYIKLKKKEVKKQEEEIDDGKEDEKQPVFDDHDAVNDQNQSDQRHTVYEIGKQFFFWHSLKAHRRFIRSKYENMKEEVMNSPLLHGLVSVRAWQKLTHDIAVIIATEHALQITSNGLSYSLYGIQQHEPLDAEHLRGLKLYTDFNELCSKFCSILRWGDPAQIAEIANLTRILVETVQCYGNPMSATKTYYRGVNRTFVFKTIATKFNLPFSTTTSVNLRIGFTDTKFWFIARPYLDWQQPPEFLSLSLKINSIFGILLLLTKRTFV